MIGRLAHVIDRLAMRRAAAVALGVSLGVLALESAVRWTSPRALMAPWQDDIQGVAVSKPEVSGRFSIPGRFDTTFSIHERFRSRHPVSLKAAADSERIAVLGDSATFGWGAEDDETYPAVLERLLRGRQRAAGGAQDVEVLNAGVIGTGTGEQALGFELWVRRFKPAVTVLTVFWNDVDDDLVGGFFVRAGDGVVPTPFDVLDRGLSRVRLTRRVANRVPGFAWACQHSQLLAWIRQRPTALFETARARAVGASLDSRPTTSDSRIPNFESRFHDGLLLLQGEVAWLRDRVRAAGSRIAIVFLPGAEVIEDGRPDAVEIRDKSAQIVSALAEICSRTSTPFVNLTPAIRRRASRERLYFPEDPHPNPSGYRAIADAAATFLIDQGLVQ